MHGPWGSAVVSAPLLSVGHPQVSAPEIPLEHTRVPQQRGGMEVAVVRVTRVPVTVGMRCRGRGGSHWGCRSPGPGGSPSYFPGRQEPACEERGHNGGPTPYASLNNATSLQWQSRFLPQALRLRISSFPSPQAVSSQQQQSSPQICSLNPTFQHPAPVHTGRHKSQAGAHSVVAWTICVGLTLSCLTHRLLHSPPISCTLLR